MYISKQIQSPWTWGFFWGCLLLGLLDKTQSEREKNERQMPGEKGGTTSATMETQREAKAPLVSSLSQAFAHTPPSSNLPCCFPRRWTGIRGSPWLSKRHTDKWKSSSEKPVFSLCLSADHFGLLSPQILCRPSLSSSFHFQAVYYSLHHDLTSTQTSSLSVRLERWECSLTKVILKKGRWFIGYSERSWGR